MKVRTIVDQMLVNEEGYFFLFNEVGAFFLFLKEINHKE